MKLSFLLTAFGLAARVLADSSTDLADEYAVIYYWYAYILEYEAEGAHPALVASGCLSPGESPICYLDEFARYIQTLGDGEIPWSGALTSGAAKSFIIDIDAAAKGLLNAGYVATVDAAKLIPSKFATGAAVAYTDILTAVEKINQSTRTIAGNIGTDVSAYVSKLQQAISSASHYRLQSSAGAQVTALTDWCSAKKCAFTLAWKTITNSDGSSYKIMDFDTMLKNNPTAKAAVRSGLAAFMADYTSTSAKWPGTTAPTASERNNFNAVLGSGQEVSQVIEAPYCV